MGDISVFQDIEEIFDLLSIQGTELGFRIKARLRLSALKNDRSIGVEFQPHAAFLYRVGQDCEEIEKLVRKSRRTAPRPAPA